MKKYNLVGLKDIFYYYFLGKKESYKGCRHFIAENKRNKIMFNYKRYNNHYVTLYLRTKVIDVIDRNDDLFNEEIFESLNIREENYNGFITLSEFRDIDVDANIDSIIDASMEGFSKFVEKAIEEGVELYNNSTERVIISKDYEIRESVCTYEVRYNLIVLKEDTVIDIYIIQVHYVQENEIQNTKFSLTEFKHTDDKCYITLEIVKEEIKGYKTIEILNLQDKEDFDIDFSNDSEISIII